MNIFKKKEKGLFPSVVSKDADFVELLQNTTYEIDKSKPTVYDTIRHHARFLRQYQSQRRDSLQLYETFWTLFVNITKVYSEELRVDIQPYCCDYNLNGDEKDRYFNTHKLSYMWGWHLNGCCMDVCRIIEYINMRDTYNIETKPEKAMWNGWYIWSLGEDNHLQTVSDIGGAEYSFKALTARLAFQADLHEFLYNANERQRYLEQNDRT